MFSIVVRSLWPAHCLCSLLTMQRYEKIAYYASLLYTLYHLLQLNVTYCQLYDILFGNLEYF